MHNTNMKKPLSDIEVPKQTRHIVSWSPEEDDILREQIRNHGTDNWAIIASKFKDKTTRQCRRRWYTYLNSDFKKGGWSPEEDMLLCEAQKIFGNRWTEIAKVVSGRTDNAVKNRFSTLCKKRAKAEALAKENNPSYINLNNKRVIFQDVSSADGLSENGAPLRKIRRDHILNLTENCNPNIRLEVECAKVNPQVRPPLAELAQNFETVRALPTQNCSKITKDIKDGAVNNDLTQGMYLKKDDPKLIALLQQAQLLSSLAVKVNTENTDQSLENAWKILQDFLNQSKDGDMIRLRISDMDYELANSKVLTEDLKSGKEDSPLSWRLSDLYVDSPDSSEYSTGSTLLNHVAGEKISCSEAVHSLVAEPQPTYIGDHKILADVAKEVICVAPSNQSEKILKPDTLPSCSNPETDDEVICAISNSQFSSPIQITPLFNSLASGIPSPQFSESERHFLLKTLGVDSPLLNTGAKAIQSPPCKRALLQSL
ncbi:transcription factor MYB124 [Daucus carota subsp. sativus]|uniref:transcription factor MYB124 n=1 Tax=Daucus carota subsp. sativus TaxID=79200 RepID=UPI0007EFA145|nr:PREDICTED: myb-related protein A-like [Daucus carota subsp. sativus]XP_017223447.1 PREDICTED: myb-related protein A-like [Daucus carota subsp. sativus]